jgi:NADH/F420H2 dehydrogenase subunit C
MAIARTRNEVSEEHDLLADIRAALPAAEFEAVPGARDVTILVRPDHLLHVCTHLRDEAHMDYLSMVTSVDRPEYFEIVYYLYSFQYGGQPLVIKVRTPKDGPGMPSVPSLTSLWRGADWQEREIYDLMGITFTGHPDMTRILMWDGFEGHPLRKDFVSKIETTTEELLPTLPEPLEASNRREKR